MGNLSKDLTRLGFVLALFIVVVIAHSVVASTALPSYKLPSSDVEDAMSDVYDGCISRLTGKLPTEEATSKCFDYVYEDSKADSDLGSPDSLLSSQKREPDDASKNTAEKEDLGTENEEDVNDAESDESDLSEEPEDQIIVLENGRKVAEY